MPAPSPVQLATSIANYAITANGAPLDTSIQVQAIDVWLGVNKLPKARLVVSDGSAADRDFPVSAGDALVPGATLEIKLGYGSSQTTVFSGVVHRHGLQTTANGPSRLVVEATDKAMVMTLARKNAIFQNTTDSNLCQSLISNAGLSADVSSTSVTHASIVQYYASDWDLMVIRAQLNGMVVIVDSGKVSIAPPTTSTSPVLTLTYGESILDFRADMDATTQLTPASIQSFAWDSSTQALATSGSAQANVATPGNISSATLAGVFNVASYWQQSAGELQAAELTAWSSAELLKSQLAKIRGEARFQGSALARPGAMVTLAGLGDRFNGDAYTSGVHHRLSEGLWRTTVEIGLSPSWFAATAPGVSAPGASGQLPPANNLMAGTVKQIDQDPDGEFRVLVTVPLLQAAQSAGVWARFGAFYASTNIGACFYPEIGDEVVLGFLSGDPRYPVVLGSLYSKKNPPPNTPVAANTLKMFMSKSKLHIDFDEDKKSISLITPAKQSVVICDNENSIVLTDSNGNTVKMNSSGITLNSASDITLSASGSITLSAQSALKASGAASVNVGSDGMVQVKGATVALNP